MWVAKLRADGKNALVGSRTKKHDVAVTGYPVSSYEKDDKIHINSASVVFGEEEQKERFIQDLRSADRTLYLEVEEEFLMLHHRAPKRVKPLYDSQIIHVRPLVIDENGIGTWTVGAWEREKLEDFSEVANQRFDAELLKMREEDISGVSIASVRPDLTSRQKRAVELAIKHGYYSHPRSTDLEELAGLMEVSYSTFQAHLRKAEKKIIPFHFERSK